jgi:hypothetical protein
MSVFYGEAVLEQAVYFFFFNLKQLIPLPLPLRLALQPLILLAYNFGSDLILLLTVL